MQEVIAWASFAGAWLLVAGPLYQGSTELAELDFDREGIQGKAAALQTAQARPSAWWWLLPPAMYVLHHRWYKTLRQAMLPQLTQTQREQVTRFQSKSTGWFTVAAGAALLATGETWQIIQHYRWPVWAFWLLVTVMLAAAVLTTTVLMIGDARLRRAGTAETAPTAEQRLSPGISPAPGPRAASSPATASGDRRRRPRPAGAMPAVRLPCSAEPKDPDLAGFAGRHSTSLGRSAGTGARMPDGARTASGSPRPVSGRG